MRLATKDTAEHEDDEAARLVRPAPKKKPPRKDKRRERVEDPDTEKDPDLQSKDRSLNYKVVGSLVDRYAASKKRVPAVNSETGKTVIITEETLKSDPKYKPVKPKDVFKGEEKVPSEKPSKPPRSKRVKAPPPDTAIPGGEDQGKAEKPPAENAPKKKPKRKPKAPKSEKKPDETKPEQGAEEGSGESGAPEEPEKKTVADKLGIQLPPQRPVSVSERQEATLLLADNLPPVMAAKLIAAKIHPDDAKDLVANFKAASARPMGNPAQFASKAKKVLQTDPDQVQPPKFWRNASGKKVAFEDLPPDEKAAAYKQHQTQVVAMSLAAQHQLEEHFTKLKLPAGVAEVVTSAMLGQVKDPAKLSQQVFSKMAETKGFVDMPDGAIRKVLAAVKDDEGAKQLATSYLEANDYKRAKNLYLNDLSEHDPPEKIAKGLKEARHFFRVQAGEYDEPGWAHEGLRRFQVKVLTNLRDLDRDKYNDVRKAMDTIEDQDHAKDVKAYDKAMKAYDKAMKKYERDRKAWQSSSLFDRGTEPTEPTKPLAPPPKPNASKSPEDLAKEGKNLWDNLFERSDQTKTARIAARYLISSYLVGKEMDPKSNPRSKVALYHGISPSENAPEPYPGWRQTTPRYTSPADLDTVVASGQEWLKSPLLSENVEGMVADQRYRAALDLALTTHPFRIDIQTYNTLLARLQGVPEPGLEQPGLPTKYAADLKLIRAIFAKFTPDSKNRAKGKYQVMLTGATASVLKRDQYEVVYLVDLSDEELNKLATLMRVKTASSQSSFATAKDTTPNPDNGASQMLRLSNDQKKAANQILGRFDKLAQEIQENHESWGIPFKTARELVNRLDKTADETEAFIYGADSLRRRQAEVALQSPDFVKAAQEEEDLDEEQIQKAAAVLQRESDEPYMETFRNPMKPIQTDADEPYMSAYSDDQSSAVVEGEDETGRELAPEA